MTAPRPQELTLRLFMDKVSIVLKGFFVMARIIMTRTEGASTPEYVQIGLQKDVTISLSMLNALISCEKTAPAVAVQSVHAV